MTHGITIRTEFADAGWETPVGRRHLPGLGVRCLFELHPTAVLNHRTVKDGFRAFGYRADRDTINLPFWNALLGIEVVKRWQYVPGPDFWQGAVISPFDARRLP